MNVVGKVGSLISQGVYSVATPFHPFGGAVDVIVVQQQDGTFRSTPWYVRFGKFQGVLQGSEEIVQISVNGTEADFHMYLDKSGKAFFLHEIESAKDGSMHEVGDESVALNDDEVDQLDVPVENICDENRLEHSVPDSGVYPFDSQHNSFHSGRLERAESDGNRRFYDFQDDQSSLEDSVDFSEFDSNRFGSVEDEQIRKSPDADSNVILVSVDGHMLTAPVSSSEQNTDNIRLSTPQFHLGPVEGEEEFDSGDGAWTAGYINDCETTADSDKDRNENDVGKQLKNETSNREGTISSSEETTTKYSTSPSTQIAVESRENNFSSSSPDLVSTRDGTLSDSENADFSRQSATETSNLTSEQIITEDETLEIQANQDDFQEASDGIPQEATSRLDISLCGKELFAGMGLDAASKAFESHRICVEEFKDSPASITNDQNLVIRYEGKYFLWQHVGPLVLGMAAFGLVLPIQPENAIPVNEDSASASRDDGNDMNSAVVSRRWRLWPIPFRRVKSLEHTDNTSSSEEYFVDTESGVSNSNLESNSMPQGNTESPNKPVLRTNVPTSDQIASLNLRDGQNVITFNFSTRVLGKQQVEAHLYLWKWNARIVISDVDGTITKSDVLGQFMPLVGKDWSQSGVAKLFSAIKENGYQLLFLSARAIVQAYLTRNFLFNLKQDGKTLPNGPVVISPDGLFPSLYREVIRRSPHEFKIACLEDIRRLFPPDYNPFYAGFGNRDTDELSYRKIGIPKGKVFIINPKGEVAVSHCMDVKSYTSLHTLVNDMFPPTSLVEQEDYNAWNFWKVPLPEIDM